MVEVTKFVLIVLTGIGTGPSSASWRGLASEIGSKRLIRKSLLPID
jgi:hypothetical protein